MRDPFPVLHDTVYYPPQFSGPRMHAFLHQSLNKWEKAGGLILVLLAAFFSDLVLFRSALVDRVMGDGPIFLRAAWAIRTGQDPYQIMDHNGWHYNYPPIYAITLLPFADPPANLSKEGYLPLALSISLIYKINWIALLLAIHALAKSLESLLPHLYPSRSRAWWYIRILPFLACFFAIGHTLMRAQSNLIVLMWLSFYLCGILTNRRYLAGFSLAAAISIKIFPAFLVVQPLVKRDFRTLAGIGVGLVLYLILIPGLVMGPQATWNSYESLAKSVLGPALGMAKDESRATELIQITATDNQSLQAIIHHIRHPWLETKPNQIDGLTRGLAMGIGLLLLGVLVVAISRKALDSWELIRQVLLTQGLICLMLFLCPVSHSHYGVMLLPGLTFLLWLSWVAPKRISPKRIGILLGVVFLSQLLAASQIPSPIPGTGILRNYGLGTVGMSWLLIECLVIGWQLQGPVSLQRKDREEGSPRLAA